MPSTNKTTTSAETYFDRGETASNSTTKFFAKIHCRVSKDTYCSMLDTTQEHMTYAAAMVSNEYGFDLLTIQVLRIPIFILNVEGSALHG